MSVAHNEAGNSMKFPPVIPTAPSRLNSPNGLVNGYIMAICAMQPVVMLLDLDELALGRFCPADCARIFVSGLPTCSHDSLRPGLG